MSEGNSTGSVVPRVQKRHLVPRVAFSWVPQSICVCRLSGAARDRQTPVFGHLHLRNELLCAANHFIHHFSLMLWCLLPPC